MLKQDGKRVTTLAVIFSGSTHRRHFLGAVFLAQHLMLKRKTIGDQRLAVKGANGRCFGRM